MRKCKYCGRYYKNYETCPGCGSVQFEEIQNPGAIFINEIPEGGYKIDMSNQKRDSGIGFVLKIIGLGLIGYSLVIFLFAFFIAMSVSFAEDAPSFDGTFEYFLAYFELGLVLNFIIPSPYFGILFYWIGSLISKKTKSTKKNLERLRTNGILIKNLKYQMKNNQIEIIYKNDSGIRIPFKSKYLYRVPPVLPDTCDILFDRDDPGIYYVDFDIY